MQEIPVSEASRIEVSEQRTVVEQMMDPVVEALEEQIQYILKEATRLMDEYWLIWRSTNSKYRSIDPDNYVGGEVAPRLTQKSGKYYLVWTHYRPRRFGKVGQTWGTHIAPTTRGYTIEQLTKNSPDWERDLIASTEPKLAVLRGSLDVVHESKVKLSRLIRRHNS
ncbi:MAG: hypothetical protein LRY40_09475 [Shewanella fodinae]|nr:hypothetical protein [Shewanella fodinae]